MGRMAGVTCAIGGGATEERVRKEESDEEVRVERAFDVPVANIYRTKWRRTSEWLPPAFLRCVVLSKDSYIDYPQYYTPSLMHSYGHHPAHASNTDIPVAVVPSSRLQVYIVAVVIFGCWQDASCGLVLTRGCGDNARTVHSHLQVETEAGK